MNKFKAFSKIGQFRTMITNVRQTCKYNELPLPTLKLTGTVKLHGTNGMVAEIGDEIVAGSRKQLLSITKDNHGFCQFVLGHDETFKSVFKQIHEQVDVPEGYSIRLYGEWAGSGIQSGVAISQLPKQFFIFAIRLTKNDVAADDITDYTKHVNLDDVKLVIENDLIHMINDFKTYELDVDFSRPELAQQQIHDWVMEVEEECPVAKHFGVSGLGEGIVFICEFQGQRLLMKAKGEKHSVSKVKTIAAVDIEKVNTVNEFVDYAVTDNRLQQGIDEVFGEDELDIRKMSDYLRWVFNDVVTEEIDTITENGLDAKKDIGKAISTKARNYFMKKFKEL